MTTKVDGAKAFDTALRRLARKYPRILNEIEALTATLEQDERPGNKIPNVGYDVYKVRLSNPSAGKGKRGGLRVVYYVRLADFVVLLTIYSKSAQTDIAPEQLRKIIEAYQPRDET